MLKYHQQPQRYHLYSLLQQICSRSFISCNRDQAATIPKGFDCIVDRLEYDDIGPMSGLLSAWDAHPEASLLVLGCDYPFFERSDIMQLVKHWQQHRKSTAYRNQEGIYEPLLAIYDLQDCALIRQRHEQTQYSLRAALSEMGAIAITSSNTQSLQSIDNLDAYKEALRLIQSRKKE